MERLFFYLQRPTVLSGLFLTTLLLTFGFYMWSPSVGGRLLDSVSNPAEIRILLDSMEPSQKTSHFWMTLLLDIIYPFAYGGLFAGLTFKFMGRIGMFAAVPALLVIPVDIAENIVQLLILNDQNILLSHKAYLTPLKRILFYIAGLTAISAVLIGFAKRYRR